MATEARIVSRRESHPAPVVVTPVRAIHVWSWIGTVLLAVTIWYTVKWVSSDAFVAVPYGPDLPPEWMRIVLNTGQVVMTTLWCFSFYWFVLRPWVRERRMTTDGFILIGCTIASLWDALTLVGQYWFTYNSYLVNRGSILTVVPMTLSPHTPEANEAWPLFFINTLYGNFVLVAIILCALLRTIRSRWPTIKTRSLVLLCFVLGAIADIVIEGFVMLPLGFWTYAGGLWAINPDKYYKFPIYEAFFAGSVFASLTAMRFFVDDKGRTLFERGIDKLVVSPIKRSYMRATAVLGGTVSIFIVCYHLPVAFLALHSTEWPDDVKNRSYFTNGICGPLVDLACPGPSTPIARPGAPRPDYSGRFADRNADPGR
jgi:hypothetical protein